MSKISNKTSIENVALTISDLERALIFYQNQLGFRVQDKNGQTAKLGTGNHTILFLEERPESNRKEPSTGLYHVAVRVPNRDTLADTLHRLVETSAPLQGFSDHGVSEAIYLEDPDGNGIEIYRDRPKKEWPIKDGQLEMVTKPLNVESLLDSADPKSETAEKFPKGTMIGHIHLKVANIGLAVTFYRDILGFELTQQYGPSAAFFGAGGYHHHIGVNTWTSAGASPPPKDAIGLQWFSIKVPGKKNFEEVIQRIKDAKIPLHKWDSGWQLQDPSSNHLLLMDV